MGKDKKDHLSRGKKKKKKNTKKKKKKSNCSSRPVWETAGFGDLNSPALGLEFLSRSNTTTDLTSRTRRKKEKVLQLTGRAN